MMKQKKDIESIYFPVFASNSFKPKKVENDDQSDSVTTDTTAVDTLALVLP